MTYTNMESNSLDSNNREITYCVRCGHKLNLGKTDGKYRPTCSGCGYVVFLDPKLSAVVLIETKKKLVMVQRATEPALGHWAFPSGFVDRGETVEDAAIREVLEETGLKVTLTNFIGLYSHSGSAVVIAVYSAQIVGGTLKAGSDAADVALVDLDRLPKLPFYHDYQILSDWKTHREDP